MDRRISASAWPPSCASAATPSYSPPRAHGRRRSPRSIHRRARRSGRTSRERRRGGRRCVLDRVHRRPRRSFASRPSSSSGRSSSPPIRPSSTGPSTRATAARDRRQAPTRRHRRGQRCAVSGVGDRGCAVRADRVVQSAGDDRPEPPPFSGFRAPTAASGTPTAPSSTAPTVRCGPTSTTGCRPRVPTPYAIWSSCPTPPPPTFTSIPPRRTTSTPAPSTALGPGWTCAARNR